MKLVSRKSKELRMTRWNNTIQRYIQFYIKNGSGGDLELSHTPITKLPSNLTYVGGNLNLHGSDITELPDNLTIDGYLSLINSKITKLPKNLKIGLILSIDFSEINDLPDDLYVGAKCVYIHDSSFIGHIQHSNPKRFEELSKRFKSFL